MTENNCYAVAFNMAKICIENGYSRDVWISPIPEEHKDEIWAKAEIAVKKAKALEGVPSLF